MKLNNLKIVIKKTYTPLVLPVSELIKPNSTNDEKGKAQKLNEQRENHVAKGGKVTNKINVIELLHNAMDRYLSLDKKKILF